jgi:hypothetical protein
MYNKNSFLQNIIKENIYQDAHFNLDNLENA